MSCVLTSDLNNRELNWDRQEVQLIKDQLKLYAVVLQEIVNLWKTDPFDWIEAHIGKEVKEDIKMAVTANVDEQASLDRLIKIIDSYWPDLITDLIKKMKNEIIEIYCQLQKDPKCTGFDSYLDEMAFLHKNTS